MIHLRKKYLFKDFRGPSLLTAQMIADGFLFDTTFCPIQLKEPKEVITEDDGTTFVQWQEEAK